MSQQNLPLLKLFSPFKLRYFERRFKLSGEFRFDISLKQRLNEQRFNVSARLTSTAQVNTILNVAKTTFKDMAASYLPSPITKFHFA